MITLLIILLILGTVAGIYGMPLLGIMFYAIGFLVAYLHHRFLDGIGPGGNNSSMI